MATYVDTSGFYAYLSASDAAHQRVVEVMHKLAGAQERLVTTSYAVSETMGLLQRRSGFSGVRRFVEAVLPVADIVWITAAEHGAGWDLMRQKPRRGLTIVDATGMVVMKREGIRRCVALDPEFAHEGFEMLP